MKRVFTIISLLFFSALHAQNANLVWAKQMGSNNTDQGRAIATDALGNVYTTGYFLSIADFNPDPLVAFNLTPAGGNDIFVSKLDASGNFVWAKQFGGSNNDQGYALAVDASGNVYTTGSFLGTADFNPDPNVSYNLISAGGSNDIFISKLDASGNFVWAKQIGATANDQGSSITIDVLGNVLTTGYFAGTADFNPDPLVTNNLVSAAGTADIFISKLDASGNFVWAKQLGTATAGDNGNAITTDALGNVYTTGYFSGTADFNPDPLAISNLVTAGSVDIFVSKLDASGNFVWAKQLGGNSGDIGYAIAVDAAGNVFTTGSFQGTADFNPDPVATTNFTAVNFDVFISKLDASGNFVWAKQLGGTSSEVGFSMALDASGNVYTGGYFQGTTDFNPDPVITNNFISAGQSDIFINKLDAAGNFLLTKQFGGIAIDQGLGVALDASGNMYATGFFSGTADFNPDPLVTNNFISAGASDIFVVKLSQSGALPINFTSIKAFQKNTGIQVEWNMATESNIRIYEIEKSLDGRNFRKAGAATPTSNNNAAAKYSWLDSYPFDGNNFYRLKAIETSGSFKYSSIVLINTRRGKSRIVINPNPVIDRTLNLQLQNQPEGIYNIRVFDNIGQLLYSGKVQHPGGSSVQTLQLKSSIPTGTYQVQISNGVINITQRVIL
ncbi:MAG: SBBP repeat-containing protein [Chitinophagaceae bacterium]|nr:SBBP repeat-containing protein [Chitinophagaceae bacterium]